MRILITGGAGCLGSNLTEHYLSSGHEVLVLDNFITGHRGSLPEGHPQLKIIEGSVIDRPLVDDIFAEFKPTYVIHSAASYKDPDNWIEDARTNVEGLIHVVDASRTSGIRRFINFHTALGYGRPTHIPIPVDAPARPFTSYGISKQAAENYLQISGLPFVSMRLANVTGPRLAIGPIPTFYSRLKQGKACFCSRTVRDLIDMEDFLSITDLALADDAPTGCFNVSTGTGHSIREIYDLVSSHLKIINEQPVPEVEPGPDDVPAVVLDPSKTMEAFGWKPRFQFADTIQRLLEWYDIYGVTAIYSHLKVPTKI
jgi:UDP-glucose 4-epimerase